MKASEIFAGPILRRAQPESVWIWIATTTPVTLEGAVRPANSGEAWATLSRADRITVFPDRLFVHLVKVEPEDGRFPTDKLLEYSLGVVKADGTVDHKAFEAIVKEDDLAYPKMTLPTFYLQGSGKLNAMYASCRKMHDDKGGANDALSYGDSYTYNNVEVLAKRPTVLCLTGDQIYCDDVHDNVFDRIQAMASTLEGSSPEKMPGGLTPPGKGKREPWVTKHAKFTANQAMWPADQPAKNHLVTFAEFVAMYGLAFSDRNWPSGAQPKELQGYVTGLKTVRRLLANVPTYMIFDDHDVTDDWNFCLSWISDMQASDVGHRIVGNALYAFWLFQGWGNDPVLDENLLPAIIAANEKRLEKPEALAALLHGKSKAHDATNTWEFFTPTHPFIYFLDTRTQRGHKDWGESDRGASAFLKSRKSWAVTLGRLQKLHRKQSRTLPMVLVSPAPVFGFDWIDKAQAILTSPATFGSYRLDKEGWASNEYHLLVFQLLCGNYDVVILSGDVHYSYSSTAKFSVFDSPFIRSAISTFGSTAFPFTSNAAAPTYHHLHSSRFLQLTASAAKNYGNGAMAKLSTLSGQFNYIMNEQGRLSAGACKGTDLYELKVTPVIGTTRYELADVKSKKPLCVFHSRVNDADNVRYIAEHNIGVATLHGRKVENVFLVNGKSRGTKTWDFATSGAWEPKVT
jgi:hypothetical protein